MSFYCKLYGWQIWVFYSKIMYNAIYNYLQFFNIYGKVTYN